MRLCSDCGIKSVTEWQNSIYDYWCRALLDAWDARNSEAGRCTLESLRSLSRVAAHVDLGFPENSKRPEVVYHRPTWTETNKYGVEIEHPEIRHVLIPAVL